MGISLSHERYEEIKQIVVELFIRYNVNCVPVSGFELSTKMGVKVIPYVVVVIQKDNGRTTYKIVTVYPDKKEK